MIRVDFPLVSDGEHHEPEAERLLSNASSSAEVQLFLDEVQSSVIATRRRLRGLAGGRAWIARGPILIAVLTPPVALGLLLRSPGVHVFGLGAFVLGLGGVGLWAYLRGPAEREAARAIDRRYDAFDRVTSLLELRARRARGEELSPYWDLFVREARAHLPPIEPREVAPRRAPRDAGLFLILTGLFVTLTCLRLPPVTVTPEEVEEEEALPGALALSVDQRELLEERAETLRAEMQTESGARWAEDFNQLSSELAGGRLGAEEAFRRLAEMSADLAADARAAELERDALKKRGEGFAEAKSTREVGAALREGRKLDAAEALRRISERLAEGKNKLSPRELDELRRAVEASRKAAEKEAESGERTAGAEEQERLEERRRRLLEKKQQQQGKLDPQEAEELERTERQLKRLSRNRKEREESLSELDRELAEAARALEQERGKDSQFQKQAAERLQRAADSLERMEQRSLSDEEKKQLIERMKQLREQLRRQKEGGESSEQSRRDFEARARGRKPGESGRGEQGAELELSRGAGNGKTQGASSGSKGSEGSQGQKEGDSAEGELSGPSTKPGTSHDPRLTGDPSRQKDGKTEDVVAVAQDTGEGASASETILSAARAGFTRRGYETLFRDYQAVAEEVMQKEKIPSGYKRQIEHYFELIRPRAAGKEER